MDGWWNRLIGRLRGESTESFTAGQSGGAAALVASMPVDRMAVRREEAAAQTSTIPSFWTRLVSRRNRTLVRTDVAATLDLLVQRVTQLCSLLEQQAAATPTGRVEQLRDAVASQCEQVRQLTTVLAGVPATLRNQTETLAAQRQTMDNVLSNVIAVREHHGETRERLAAMDRSQQEACQVIAGVVRTVEQGTSQVQSQSQVLNQVLQETRAQQTRVQESMRQQSRRATILTGFAIGLAAASALFGAMGLYLRWVGH